MRQIFRSVSTLLVLGSCAGTLACSAVTPAAEGVDSPMAPAAAEAAAAVGPSATGVPGTEASRGGPREIVVAGSGDLLVHPRVRETAMASEDRFAAVLEGLARAIADLEGRAEASGAAGVVSLVNLETPLTEAYEDPINTRPPTLGSPPELAADLARVGVDAVSLANNHAFDQRAEGLLDSLATARVAGLTALGVGPDLGSAYRPAVVERGGVRVALVAFAQFVNHGPGRAKRPARVEARVARLSDTEQVRAALAAAREQADLVVVAVHWSSDFEDAPLPSQRRLARRLVDWGADVIFGTGPHVLHEVERLPSPRGEAVVAYSLGNLVSNQGLRHRVGERAPRGSHPVATHPGSRDGVLLAVRVRLPEVGGVEVDAVEGVALWTANNYWETQADRSLRPDVRVVRLEDAPEDVRAERGRAIEAALGPAVRLSPR